VKIELEKLKSAVVIDDVEEIERALSERPKLTKAQQLVTPSFVVDKEHRNIKVVDPRGSSLKMRLSDYELQSRAEDIGVKWQADMAGRTIPYWMSDERPDAHGDIVRQNWLFDLFDKNPVMVLSHDWGGLPIGNIVHHMIMQRKEDDYQGPALYGDSLFAPPSISEFADSVYRLAATGFLRACSVGFVSDRVIDIKDDDERAELGLGRWGYILDQNHLLELSPCTLGANPGAGSVLTSLVQAKQRGLIHARDLQVMREFSRIENRAKADNDSVISQDRRLLSYAKALFPSDIFAPITDVEQSLTDKEMLEEARRTWVNISVEKEAKEKAKEEPETSTAAAVVRAAPPATVDDKLDALASMVEELMVSMTTQLSELNQTVADMCDQMDQLMSENGAATRGESAADEDPDGDASSSVDGGGLAALGASLDRAKGMLTKVN
jgi:hypothetical protein